MKYITQRRGKNQREIQQQRRHGNKNDRCRYRDKYYTVYKKTGEDQEHTTEST